MGAMDNIDTVNCYCFNALCKGSIFASKNYKVVYHSLARVLSNPIFCGHCGSELISKPLLEIKLQISHCLDRRPLKAIVINRDPAFHTSITTLLKDISDFDKILHCGSGYDALQYLEKNKSNKTLLPDLILIEGVPGYDNVMEFLEAYAHIYPQAKKKSSIYITADLAMKGELLKTSDHNLVKGTIFKPLEKEVLRDITAILDLVFN
jgi:hypothetical protein